MDGSFPVDERLREFVARWASDHRGSLIEHPQDFAMSEVIEAVPDVRTEPLVPLALELLDVLRAELADLPSVETSLALEIGSFAHMTTEPPDFSALELAPHAIQVYATPEIAGTIREIEFYERPVDWFGDTVDARYQVSRPVGREFADEEYNAFVIIRHKQGNGGKQEQQDSRGVDLV
jgi:hypothetical protein